MKRLLCRVFGHRESVSVTGRVGAVRALASVCPRCKTIISLEAATRAARRRAKFAR